jgi:RNA polymerase sigma-70 factor (ECF subfamily)
MTEATAIQTSMTLLRELGNPDCREAAWKTFLQRYQPLIYSWSRRKGLSHDDAEEVSAAVLARLVTALRHFVYDPSRSFRGWLKKLVENEANGLHRLWKRRPGDRGSGHPLVHSRLAEVPTPDPIPELVDLLDDTLARDLSRAEEIARRVQARVEPHTWLAFWLTAIGKQPGRQVADRLGMTVGQVFQAKYRVGQLLDAEVRRAARDEHWHQREGDEP